MQAVCDTCGCSLIGNRRCPNCRGDFVELTNQVLRITRRPACSECGFPLEKDTCPACGVGRKVEAAADDSAVLSAIDAILNEVSCKVCDKLVRYCTKEDKSRLRKLMNQLTDHFTKQLVRKTVNRMVSPRNVLCNCEEEKASAS